MMRLADMAADLTSARRKAARAKEQLDTLRDEVAAYLDPPPWRFVEETKRNSYALRSYIDRAPDPEWEIDIGQIGIQARSALDYLIQQLIIDSGNDPARGRPQFPIFRDRDQYFDKRGKSPSFRDNMLKGVDERYRRVIDQFQPYQRGGRVDDDPLSVLDTVTNRDKHRDIHVALAATTGTHFKLLFSDGRIYDVKINVGDSPQGIVDGEVFLGIDNQPPPGAPDQQVKMQVEEIKVNLFFEGDNGRLISLDDLERAVLQVARIIERFAKPIKP
jgi:hypothetical protein